MSDLPLPFDSQDPKGLMGHILDVVEQPLVLAALAILAALVDIISHVPTLLIVGVLSLLGVHRSGKLKGKPIWRVQVPSYFVLLICMSASLFGFHILVKKSTATVVVDFVRKIKDAVKMPDTKYSPSGGVGKTPELPPAPHKQKKTTAVTNYTCHMKLYQRRLFMQSMAEAPRGSIALIAIGDSSDTSSKDCYELLPSLFPKEEWTVRYTGGDKTTIQADDAVLDSPFTCFAKDTSGAAALTLKKALKAVNLQCDWTHPHSELMHSGDVGILINRIPN